MPFFSSQKMAVNGDAVVISFVNVFQSIELSSANTSFCFCVIIVTDFVRFFSLLYDLFESSAYRCRGKEKSQDLCK